MSPFFGSIFWLAVTLGVLVTFHEFGHYWVARRCGVRVLRFSVGFGRAIWRRVGRDGTEYQIAAIPLGGYVKMLDAREGDVDPADRGHEFTAKPVWQRIAIVVAGPAFNLLFTIVALWAMFIIGRPDMAPLVSPDPAGIAAHAGLRDGDRLISVNGNPVTTWSTALEALSNGLLNHEALPVHVRGLDGSERNVVLPLQTLDNSQDIGKGFDSLGLDAYRPAIVDTVRPGDPAALAGVKSGDLITSVNGQAVGDFSEFMKLLPKAAEKSPSVQLGVHRGNQDLTLAVTARRSNEDGTPRWIVGVMGRAGEEATERYAPVPALGQALKATWTSTQTTFNLIGKMVSGQASTKNLSGVVGIAEAANDSAGRGVAWFLNFLAMVSLSLAILNMLPIPVLDGGHLLYYLIELVKGSPVSERTMIAGQYVGLALLFTLMGLAFFNDIHRHFVS